MRVPAAEESTAAHVEGQRSPQGLAPAVLFAFYGALCLLPLVLAALQGHPARNLFRELSSGLVMVGYVMTLVQFLLSGRLEWLTGRIGIDRIMRFHQVLSSVILAIILVHPLLYVVPRFVLDPVDALAALRRMFTSQSLLSGVIAWWLMIALVPIAIFRDRLSIRYELWRFSHGLMALAIAVLGTHHTVSVGTYSADRWLAAFWIVATSLALLAMLHVYVLKPLLQRRAPYRVVSNRKVADRMWDLAVEPEHGSAMRFAAGQFVWLNLGHSPFSLTEHPFSISSAPVDRRRISFTIKESGDFTRHVGSIAIGTRAYLDGPYGNFTLAGREARGVVFIAGGVGLAPVMSIVRQLKAERYPHPLRLIYGNRVETQILYREEIDAFKQALDFAVHYVLSEPPSGWTGLIGELTPGIVHKCLPETDSDDWCYFVCGPLPMMNSVERALMDRGISRARIVSERFKYQ
jgi:predicted ferric reductase